MKQPIILTTLIAVILIIPFTDCFAQILNVEQYRFEDDTTLWTGNTTLTYVMNENQVRTTSYGAVVNIARYHPNYKWVLISSSNFVSINGQNGINNAHAHSRYTQKLTSSLSGEGFLQIQSDQVRGMNLRMLAGIGIRLKAIKTDGFLLTIGSGGMIEDERWSFSETDSTSNFLKSTSYVSASGELSKEISFNLISYYQARFDLMGKPRVSLDASINFKVKKWLLFTTSMNLFYDEAPIVPIEKLIYTLTNGLTIRF